MIKISDKTQCCGCSSCDEICPVNCINMVEDNEGFLFPQVDTSACINCGACDKACPIIQADCVDAGEIVEVFEQPKTIGGWIKDDAIRADSSSGGAFSLFANYVLSNGGIVYGAAICNDNVVRHIAVEKTEDLYRLRGSKYVQSIIGDSYFKIKQNLNTGRMVLFVGTPCQAAGLYSFLGKQKYDNLYIIDFICHGTPSPKVFDAYVKYLEKKHGCSINSFRFRTKDRGWNPSGLQLGTVIEMSNGKHIRNYPAFKDPFMNGFLDDSYLRDSCYSCRFKSLPKYYADITIADFWGVTKDYPQLNDGKGTSLVLLNCEHGAIIFDLVQADFFGKEVDFEKSIRRNQTLIKSAKQNSRRNQFFREFQSKSFSYLMIKYMNPFVWAEHKMIAITWKLVQKIIRDITRYIIEVLNITWKEDN
ncbi:Coenzyme F420 hydrogenase/dehydrogenase, beta subunit C-terminal domain [Pseudobutyrivibrio xylanivorans]|uniref:Coenzyme F420-reducing hydrogenase, beta subunit n=1 Tax=Pseudobutyrivibrio xylanivorans DSM 14809 TaxID=1123012 RepID=A0A1M6KMI2_PSEXY|nr:Coenzyme F420 hydrogenase/dehydrogenase, beta subunit C-terminal domain [Pseudobutyrivibrio xylanivorans]SHJ60268.1 Coenzyme F420-reducing hydrogenase, beta subunit [Pseudobutyrivibrio xylanivorans DSM 14809]